MIVRKLIEQENLTPSDEEIENGFKRMSENLQRPLEEITNYKKDENKSNICKHSLLEKKAIKPIVDHSHIVNVEPEAKQEHEP